MGDFNTITSISEKIGGRTKAVDSIDAFNSFINRGDMADLGFVGYKFTWSNRSFEGNLVREWIDKGLASSEWRMNYPEARIMHLDNNGSDHNPILLDLTLLASARKEDLNFKRDGPN